MTGALLLALLASSWTLVGIIDGAGWWWALVGFGALLLVAPALLRSLGVPRVVATLLDLLLFCLVVDAAYGHPILGIIPTPEGLGDLVGLSGQAMAAIQHESIPAAPLPELLFLVVGIGGLVAVLLDLAGATLPALAGVLLLAVAAVPAVFVPEGVSLLALAGLVVAYFVVLAADANVRLRIRGRGAGVAVVAASVGLALVVTLLAPGLKETWWRDTTTVTTKSASSLVDLAQDLQQSSSAEVLRYTTTRTPTPYLQLATLDDYDGTTWVHRPGPQSPIPAAPAVGPPPPGLASTVATDTYDTTITIEGLSADWAPAPYPARAVNGQDGQWSVDDYDLSLSIADAALGAQEYTVRSTELEPRDSDMLPLAGIAAGPALYGDATNDLELPADIPEIIPRTAAQVAAGQTTEIGIARALQAFFREGGFTYSTRTPDADAEDGMQIVASFLERKSGYCIHFASAMTVMARSLGIPARIAIGYLPGDRRIDDDGEVYYAETNQRLHAWPQLFFAGVGWLDFEPTVSLGSPRDYSFVPGTAPSSSTPSSSPVPIAAPSEEPEDDPSPSAAADEPETSSETDAAATARIAGWSTSAALLILLLAVPGVVRALRRRGRLRGLEEGGPAVLAWAEITDTTRDVGLPLDPAETPRAFAARLASDWPPGARADLNALVLDVEHATFGPAATLPTGADLAALTRTILREIEAGLAPGARLLARVLPRSLLTGLRVNVRSE